MAPRWEQNPNSTGRATAPLRFQKRLRLEAQRIGHARNVVEESNDLDRVHDGLLAEAETAQGLQVALRHVVLGVGQLGCERAQAPVRLGQVGGLPIVDKPVQENVGLRWRTLQCFGDLFTEIVGMGLRSIGTGQFGRHHRGQHLPLHTRKVRGPVHCLLVELHGRL